MEKLQKALELVAKAEGSLRDLMRDCIERGDYDDVAFIAEIANKVKQIGAEFSPRPAVELVQRTGGEGPRETPQRASHVARRAAQSFPRFEVEGDRLVKIGWSKKDRSTYEHRVPRGTALAVALGLAERIGKGVFRMDDLLPMIVDGTEVPLYQAYLVLAWLRSLGLIEKDGKEGYTWSAGSFNAKRFDSGWQTTAQRALS